MVPKSSLFIRIVAGAYIIYLGGRLIESSIKDQPGNYILYIAAGVVFVAIGLYWLVGSAVKMIKKEYRDDSIRGRLEEAEGKNKEGQAEETRKETIEEATEENLGTDVSEKEDKPCE